MARAVPSLRAVAGALVCLALASGLRAQTPAQSPAPVASAEAAPAHASPVQPVASAASGLPPGLPLRRDEPEAPQAGVPWFTGLLLLGLLAAAGFALVRHLRGSLLPRGLRGVAPAGAVLTRVASQSLTPQASVHVLRWNGEEILVGCTPQQVSLLSRRSVDEAERAGGAPEKAAP